MTIFPATNSFREAGASSIPERHDLLRMVAARYERCRPDDTFEDLCNRARFSKEDRRLMEDWLAAFGAGAGQRIDGQGEPQ
ncbi:MAG: hypothetical protein ABIF45_00990 [Pseudomonadota bacterium]